MDVESKWIACGNLVAETDWMQIKNMPNKIKCRVKKSKAHIALLRMPCVTAQLLFKFFCNGRVKNMPVVSHLHSHQFVLMLCSLVVVNVM